MGKDDIANTRSFKMYWGKRNKEKFTWEILSEGEYIMEDPLEKPEEAEFRVDMDMTHPLDQLFFDFFPLI